MPADTLMAIFFNEKTLHIGKLKLVYQHKIYVTVAVMHAAKKITLTRGVEHGLPLPIGLWYYYCPIGIRGATCSLRKLSLHDPGPLLKADISTKNTSNLPKIAIPTTTQ